jgi:hypothetical protein
MIGWFIYPNHQNGEFKVFISYGRCVGDFVLSIDRDVVPVVQWDSDLREFMYDMTPIRPLFKTLLDLQ